MLESKLLILLAVIGGTIAIAAAIKYRSHTKASNAAPEYTRAGLPTLIYFWSPTCAECRSSQSRIVDAVSSEADGFEVVRVNVHDAPEKAKAFGIFTVPTTVVLDSGGKVHAINTGGVDQATLRSQIDAVIEA